MQTIAATRTSGALGGRRKKTDASELASVFLAMDRQVDY
jgi:hypothetical protein